MVWVVDSGQFGQVPLGNLRRFLRRLGGPPPLGRLGGPSSPGRAGVKLAGTVGVCSVLAESGTS